MPRTLAVDPATAVPLKEFGKLLKPHRPYTTVWTWCHVGCVNRRTHVRVFLDCISLPVGLATDMSAYERFIEKLTERPQ